MLVLTGVLLFIGGTVGAALGLRRLWLFATAPVIAIPVVGGAAIIAPLVGVPWSILPVIALAALAAVGVWLLCRRFGEPMRRRRLRFWTSLAIGIAALIITVQVVAVIGAADNFSNTFDNVFHLNVVTFILDTQNASSLWVGHLTDHSGSAAFYPAAWHDLVSLVAQLGGVSSLVAVNATTLVISALIWPAGVVLLTRQLFGENRVVLLTAGILAAAFPLFPLLMMDYGVLYPYQLGVALLPATIAATLRATRIGKASPRTRPWQSWVLLGGMLPGVFLAHPGAFVAWMAFTVPIAAVLTARGFARASNWDRRLLVAVALIAYLVVGFVLLMVLRPSSGRDWPIELRVRYAVLEVFTGSAWYGVPAVLGTSLALVGIVWAILRHRAVGLAAAGMLAVAAILYVVVTSLPYPDLRDALTGSWYNNRPRLAALLPIMAVPVGAYGAGATWAWLRSRPWIRKMRVAPARPVRWAVGSVIVVAACLATQLPAISPVPVAVARAGEAYRTSPSARLITSDELELLTRLEEVVPADAVIVGSPWTGTALAYALADRSVVLPHMFTTTTDAENEVLNGLNQASPGSPACDAVEETNVEYVLDFGTQEIHGAANVFPGLTDLDESDALELVDQQGEARLYRIVGC
ncbi:hypothetical protein K0817_013245 [Microbacterium sp. HD4P20]|uniref:DUF6541 family protein n=1 Tax=Microbacterium sp. HD4P20 TaxID=2864874 RepID=UPI0020A31C9D|nr:DUF6541 family protein [Microbacterium sp. HD4P20]MCP2637523.1 hypothetical protein [Microbacterium sp. HD4P20]